MNIRPLKNSHTGRANMRSVVPKFAKDNQFEGTSEMEKIPTVESLPVTAESVVQRQFEAYNARDLDAWLATYKDDAEQYILHAGLVASGHEAIRKRMVDRFNDPALHAELVSRTVMDGIVVDHELVTRTFPEGLETVEMICIYEVHSGFIVKATFAIGQARPLR